MYQPTTVSPNLLAGLLLAPTSVVGGSTATCTGTVTLANVTAVDSTIVLSSSDPSVTVPATVTVAAGQKAATFPLIHTATLASTSVTIKAQKGAVSKTSVLTVKPNLITAFTIAPTSFVGGSSTVVTGTITLGSAVLADTPVTLASADPAVTVPGTVTIMAGQNSATFTVTDSAVTATKLVKVTVTLGASSRSMNVQVKKA